MSGLVLSLFPGIGLLDMAFEGEGFCIVRGPDVLWGGDIRTFHPPAGVFAGVIGGPPCQAFSTLANLVRAKGHEPKFGNMIPEFERVVAEAEPAWLLMENVRAAPLPVIEGYAVTDFLLCNSWIAGPDGFGQEQERMRRFSFGVRGEAAPNLRRWIQPAALLLPDAHPPVTGGHGEDTKGTPERIAKARARQRSRTTTVAAWPVEAYDSGKDSTSGRVPAVRAGSNLQPTSEYLREKQPTITGAHTCSHRPNGGRGERRTLAEMCRLQGLPEDFLEDAPFTVDGKRKAIANGVPLPMGRAVAKAVKEAIQ